MKSILFAVCLFIFTPSLQAQYTREDAPPPQATAAPQSTPSAPQQSPFWSHVSIGGGFGLQFGDPTLVGLSPLFSYHFINNAVIIGIGPMYQYFNVYDQYGNSYTSTSYGGRICATVFLPGRLSNLFLHGEYDVLNVPDDYSVFANVTRATVVFPLAGIGFKRPITDKSFYYLLFSYNFNNSLLSPYFSNPVMEAGFDFGL